MLFWSAVLQIYNLNGLPPHTCELLIENQTLKFSAVGRLAGIQYGQQR